ncbi:hypothetical protein PHJA_002446200 [Phtheirospermum japonicum]|uniref:Replication protein A 70 kDa DNA-binding subunit B/D first OB fold domain-containing protein n=1 Tax=Phtheirospermum japonicum TaxID=374723 RepID=A0A830D455_9LAMI|nr:hypothetical protein PHJA_002446200 [Phtheirospermum japonicum]
MYDDIEYRFKRSLNVERFSMPEQDLKDYVLIALEELLIKNCTSLEAKLSQIEPGIRAFIVVRIVRLWKTMLPPHNEFISLDFVAFDDQKNAMHGTIPSKYSDELEYQLIEGRVYKIKMFQVTKRKQSHNALPMEKMLYLNSTTEIEEINNDIDGYPHYYFQFATMEDIVHRTDHEYFMTDIFPTGEKYISTSSASKIYVNLDIPETALLNER